MSAALRGSASACSRPSSSTVPSTVSEARPAPTRPPPRRRPAARFASADPTVRSRSGAASANAAAKPRRNAAAVWCSASIAKRTGASPRSAAYSCTAVLLPLPALATTSVSGATPAASNRARAGREESPARLRALAVFPTARTGRASPDDMRRHVPLLHERVDSGRGANSRRRRAAGRITLRRPPQRSRRDARRARERRRRCHFSR